MRTATCKLKSVSPYSQSKFIQEKKSRDITHEDFEEKTWRQRMHVNEKGNVFVPPMAMKNVLSEAAKFKSTQIPGKGKSTYTRFFDACIMCVDPIDIGVKAADVVGDWVHVPSDGIAGGSKRVLKCFPIIPKWEATVEFMVLDETITEEIFAQTLDDAGKLIGIGRFRPRNRGYYGRFEVLDIKWS